MIDNKNGSCGTYEPVGIVSVSDTVEIIGGIFTGYSGRLSEISADGAEVTVVVSTVGRDMPIKASVNEIRRSAQ